MGFLGTNRVLTGGIGIRVMSLSGAFRLLSRSWTVCILCACRLVLLHVSPTQTVVIDQRDKLLGSTGGEVALNHHTACINYFSLRNGPSLNHSFR
jgi:hypothetical protein